MTEADWLKPVRFGFLFRSWESDSAETLAFDKGK